MLKLTRIVVFTFLCLLLISCHSRFNPSNEATVLKVIDGDTFVVLFHGREEKVRLLGVDTPEKCRSRKLKRDASRCKVAEDRILKLGIEATRYTKELIHKGDRIYLEVRGRGYYGRPLVLDYFKDGTCYNKKIIAGGYACVYKYRGKKSKQLSRDEFLELMKLLDEAEAHKRGLWKIDSEVMTYLCK